MEPVTITGMDRVRDPRPSRQGHIILAHFSADIGMFSFKGCVLVRTARQGIAAWLPKLDEPRHARHRAVTLTDEPTRNALLKAAREMYIRMGGTEAEWRPRDDEPIEQRVRSIYKPMDPPAFVPRNKGDIGYDGFPLERDLTDEEADEGLARFLGEQRG